MTAGIEAMVKTADVQCVAVERLSSGYYATAVQGPLAAVRQAIDAGSVAVRQYGELRSSQVYAKPHDRAVRLLDNGTGTELVESGHAGVLDAGDGE